MSPGPATLSMAAVGSAFGFSQGLRYLLGCATGLIGVMILVAVGLLQLVEFFPSITLLAGFVGVSYILYLAFKIATQPADRTELENNGSPGFFAGVVVSLSNPKGWAVMAALFSSMGPAQSLITPEVLIRLLILSAITVLGNLAWTMLGERLSRILSDPVKCRILNRIFAALLVISVIWAVLL